jgi:hypothetical protein
MELNCDDFRLAHFSVPKMLDLLDIPSGHVPHMILDEYPMLFAGSSRLSNYPLEFWLNSGKSPRSRCAGLVTSLSHQSCIHTHPLISMEEPQRNISQDGALQRLIMWERGTIRNPNETSFAINNLNVIADIPCSSLDRAGLYSLVHPSDSQATRPYVIKDR